MKTSVSQQMQRYQSLRNLQANLIEKGFKLNRKKQAELDLLKSILF